MKFKYNPLEKRLWKIEDDCLYEISEQNRQTEHLIFIGTKIRFRLGERHWIIFHSQAGLDPSITVNYTKPLQNGELVNYQKQINPGFFKLETIFEFTETDRMNKE